MKTLNVAKKLPIFHPRYLAKIKESNIRPTVQGLLNQSSLARQTAAWNHCQPLSKSIGVWVLEYQRACPQENHPDMAGLHLKLPPLFLYFLLSYFPLILFLSPHQYSLCPSTFLSFLCHLLFWSPSFLFFYLAVFSPSSVTSPFLSLCVFTFHPLSLNDPQCCWISYPCSQNCKASWDQRSESKEGKIEKGRVLWCRHTRPPSLHRQSARHSSWGQRNWLALFPLLSEWY